MWIVNGESQCYQLLIPTVHPDKPILTPSPSVYFPTIGVNIMNHNRVKLRTHNEPKQQSLMVNNNPFDITIQMKNSFEHLYCCI